MSSIHEALKKAQRDRLAPLPAATVVGRKRNARRSLWSLVGLLVFVDIGIAAWFFWPKAQTAGDGITQAVQLPSPKPANQALVATEKTTSPETSKQPAVRPTLASQAPAAFEPVAIEPAKPSAQPAAAQPSPPRQRAPQIAPLSEPAAESAGLQQWASLQTIQALIVKQSKPEKSFAIVSGKKVRRGHRFANGAVVTDIQAGVVEVRDATGRAFIRSE